MLVARCSVVETKDSDKLVVPVTCFSHCRPRTVPSRFPSTITNFRYVVVVFVVVVVVVVMGDALVCWRAVCAVILLSTLPAVYARCLMAS
jgi:hypothetical protein